MLIFWIDFFILNYVISVLRASRGFKLVLWDCSNCPCHHLLGARCFVTAEAVSLLRVESSSLCCFEIVSVLYSGPSAFFIELGKKGRTKSTNQTNKKAKPKQTKIQTGNPMSL
jgi:hypothetical protein